MRKCEKIHTNPGFVVDENIFPAINAGERQPRFQAYESSVRDWDEKKFSKMADDWVDEWNNFEVYSLVI